MSKFSELKETFHQTFLDHRFFDNKTQYLIQCGLAITSVTVTLIFLNIITNTVVIAAIGSTSFIVYTVPHRNSSKAKYIIGAYLLGIIIGTFCHGAVHLVSQLHIPLAQQYFGSLMGAVAIGLTMLGMVILNVEHAPAAGLALGLVLDEWSVTTVVVTFTAIILIVWFRDLLKRYLIDLI